MQYIPLSLEAVDLGSTGHASPLLWALPTVEVCDVLPQEEKERKTEREREGGREKEKWREKAREREKV